MTKENKKKEMKYSILLVEDDTFISDMYSYKFANNGYDVVVANTADSALEILRNGRIFDAITIDYVMEGKSGIDFLRSGTSEKLFGDAVLIALTNQDGSEVKNEYARYGVVDDYIVKIYFTPAQVVSTVTKFIEEHKKNISNN